MAGNPLTVPSLQLDAQIAGYPPLVRTVLGLGVERSLAAARPSP
jgi:hypothetical protein